MPGRSYFARIGTKITPVTSRDQIQDRRQYPRASGRPNLRPQRHRLLQSVDRHAGSVRSYEQNRTTGSFIVIDRYTNHTLGAGMIAFGLRRGTNIHWQPLLVGKAERAAHKTPKAGIVWLTGLSGAGKSTIANMVEQSFTLPAITRCCWTATMSATGSIATSASPRPTGSRISAAPARWQRLLVEAA